MTWSYITGVLRITNLLIAIFVLLYAYMFLNKTAKRQETKPWLYLFVSAFIFTMYQIFALVNFFADSSKWQVDFGTISLFVEFLFSGLVLLAFVSQNYLIVKSPLLLISRKSDEK